MKPEFEVGDCVQIAAEFRDANDAVTIYGVKVADVGRYVIEPLRTGYGIPPIQVIAPEMVEKLTPDHVVRCLKYANERGQEGALCAINATLPSRSRTNVMRTSSNG